MDVQVEMFTKEEARKQTNSNVNACYGLTVMIFTLILRVRYDIINIVIF